MPELPEIETVCSMLKPVLVGETIKAVAVQCARLRYPVSQAILQNALCEKILAISRRGKYILFHFEKGGLLWHLGMSGSMRVELQPTPLRQHDHVEMTIGNYYLRYHDPRRFGFVLIVNDFTHHPLLQNLGLEPLTRDFSPSYLYQTTRNKSVSIKQAIMENKLVVGVGNIYANEALFDAHISPQKVAKQLSQAECKRLCASIKKILKMAIRIGGTTLRDFVNPAGNPGYFKQKLLVYGRDELLCRICEYKIEKTILGQRSTYFCRRCQQ